MDPFTIIILLVGSACGQLDYYQAQLPSNFVVACSGYETLDESMATYQILTAHGWNVLYVVDERSMLPEEYHPDTGERVSISGVAYPSLNYGVAWRYMHTIIHEAAHLRCECNHGAEHDFWMEWLVR